MTKPIDNPDHISILLPTRSRTEKLALALDSIEQTVADRDQMDVWVYVDADDEATRDFIRSDSSKKYSYRISFHIGERTKTLVETCNILWRESTNAGIYMPAGDDFRFISKGWDRIVREAFAGHPDRLVLAYAVDVSSGLEDLQFPVFSAEWMNLLGCMFIGHFPYWFADEWLDEIAIMIQRKKRLDMRMQPIEGKGKTHRMKNVPFWYRFFKSTRDERISAAELLRRAIYPAESAEYRESVLQAKESIGKFIERNNDFDDARCLGWEKNLAEIPTTYSPEYVKNYLSVELDAVHRLVGKLDFLMKADDVPGIMEILDNLVYASQKLYDIQYLRGVYLVRLGRLGEARQALEEELHLQPGDAKTLRLFEEIKSNSATQEDADGVLKSGLDSYNRTDYRMAYRRFVTATLQYPHYAPGYSMLGLTLMRLGRNQEAEDAFKRALALDPRNSDAIRGLGTIGLGRGR